MTNKHLEHIRNITLNYIKVIEGRAETFNSLKAKYENGDIGKNAYDAQVEEVQAMNEGVSQVQSKFDQVMTAYKNDLEQWSTLDGNDLTDDAKIFNSPLKLEMEDYQRLEAKHQCNFTMLRAIKEHAEKNNFAYGSKYSVNTMEKVASMQEFINVATNIVNTSNSEGTANYMGMLWSDADKFNGLYEDTARDVQTGTGTKSVTNSDGSKIWV